MIDLLNNTKLAKACQKRREQREKQKAAPKITKAHGAVYIRADLAPEAYKKAMLSHNAATSELPKCDRCKTSKHVVYCGPDAFGSAFHCRKCKASWAQST